MRPTITDIFAAWKKLAIILTLLLSVIAFTAIEEYTSFDKVNNLQEQKKLVNFIAEIGRMDLEFAAIQYRGKSTMLAFEREKLLTLNSYDIVGQLFTGQNSDYLADLDKLQELIAAFTQKSGDWYDPDKTDLKVREKAMQDARENLIAHINMMIEKNIAYDYMKFLLQQSLIYLALLLMIMMLVTYLRKFSAILKDVRSLYLVDMQGDAHTIITEEISIIAKRMNRKPQAGDNPSMIDPVTEINNYKGLLYAYTNKKNVKEGTHVAVCTFEIDDFSSLDKKYTKNFTQSVLKKIAFMTSLYQQPTDIIGRTDYSQFTLIFSRNEREQALRDCQLIMKNIEETVFKAPNGDNLSLTISAGFAPKIGGSTIDETIEQSKKVLDKAKEKGPNKLLQTKDIIR
jgi:diguanylate cyclase (GGDEF)-like protein